MKLSIIYKGENDLSSIKNRYKKCCFFSSVSINNAIFSSVENGIMFISKIAKQSFYNLIGRLTSLDYATEEKYVLMNS